MVGVEFSVVSMWATVDSAMTYKFSDKIIYQKIVESFAESAAGCDVSRPVNVFGPESGVADLEVEGVCEFEEIMAVGISWPMIVILSDAGVITVNVPSDCGIKVAGGN